MVTTAHCSPSKCSTMELGGTISLLTALGTARYDLINRKKAAKKGHKYKNSGYLNVNFAKVETLPTFLDFIQSGTQVGSGFCYSYFCYLLFFLYLFGRLTSLWQLISPAPMVIPMIQPHSIILGRTRMNTPQLSKL